MARDQSRDAPTITIGAFEAFATVARLHGVTLRMVTGAWLQIFCGNYTEASALLNELVALARRALRFGQNDVEEEHLPEVKRIFHPK